MSVCFALGQVIYYFCCPKLVKQFANWGEYRNAHQGDHPLIDILAAQLEEYDEVDRERLHRQISDRLRAPPGLEQLFKDIQHPKPVPRPPARRRLVHPKPLPESPAMRDLVKEYINFAGILGREGEGLLSDVFSIILEDVQRCRRAWRVVCGWSFLMGFILFFFTAIVNFCIDTGI